MDISKFNRSETEQTGQWFDLGQGARVKVRAVTHKAFKKDLEIKMKPHLRLKRMGTLDPKIEDDLTAEAMARHIFVEFEGLEENGKKLENNYETRLRLIRDTKLGNYIGAIAIDIDNFTSEIEEEGIENAKKS
jgi:hypothetical protein